MVYTKLIKKAEQYQKVIENTSKYRQQWKDHLKKTIEDKLEEVIKETGLPATIEHKPDLDNLEAVILTLGQEESGISEHIGKARRPLIKSKGMLIYQQLFNGKVMVSIMFPFIESLAKPQPPKSIEILRPEELKPLFILRHVEEFLKEVIAWEDYDDNTPQPIGFQSRFQKNGLIKAVEQ